MHKQEFHLKFQDLRSGKPLALPAACYYEIKLMRIQLFVHLLYKIDNSHARLVQLVYHTVYLFTNE